MKARGFALGACLGLLACGSDDGDTSADPKENMINTALRVLPPEEDYRGKNLEAWAIEYMRWHYSWTSEPCLTAENDRDGSRCTFNQTEDSPVFLHARAPFQRGARTGWL